MTPVRETGGRVRSLSWSWALLAVLVMVLSGVAAGAHAAPGAAAPAAAPHVATAFGAVPAPSTVHPLLGTPPPTIIYFYLSPDAFVETTGNASVNAYAVGASNNLTYAYTGLPPGCASQNSTYFFCTPTANGTFVVELTVTDAYGNASTSNATLYVYPWAVGGFLAVTPAFADPANTAQPCSIVNAAPFYTGYCYQQEQSPSVMTFPNGTEAAIASVTTRMTTNSCSVAATNTLDRVQVFLTMNGGLTFSTPIDIGGSTCKYLNAIEPSFAVSSNGNGYGVFVEENSSALPGHYTNRAGDALGFTSSTTNGWSWSSTSQINPTGMPTGYLAHPVLATFGSTVYVAYEDIANSSNTLPGGGAPIAIQMVYSTNGGSSWNGPYTVPGLNASQY